MLKCNPGRQNKEEWLALAEAQNKWVTPREGKRVSLFSIEEEQYRDGQTYRFRRVMQITERTSTASGQMLLLPEIEIEGWWTSLDHTNHSDEAIIALYKDHATSEQFYSEFKTDLDIYSARSGFRLSSGRFLLIASLLK